MGDHDLSQLPELGMELRHFVEDWWQQEKNLVVTLKQGLGSEYDPKNLWEGKFSSSSLLTYVFQLSAACLFKTHLLEMIETILQQIYSCTPHVKEHSI